MSKPVHKNNPVLPPRRSSTNWGVVGGIIGGGVLLIGALLVWASSSSKTFALDTYCSQNPERCIVQGISTAKVTVYELYDYGCTACQSYAVNTEGQVEEKLVSAGLIRYVHLPVALWAETADSAEGAYCAAEQKAFKAWHKQMYATMTEGHTVELTRMQSVAQQVGMDAAAFTQCVQSDRYAAWPGANMAAAKLQSTPTFFVNGSQIVGAVDFATLERAVKFAQNVAK